MDKQFSTESMSNRHVASPEPECSKCAFLNKGHLELLIWKQITRTVCTSLVAQCRHHTCYSFSETILENAVHVLPINQLIKEQSILKELKK